jgi:hypothetical protein
MKRFILLLLVFFASAKGVSAANYSCVWDQFNTPKCQLRQIGNPCFAQSDASKCNSIADPASCNSASFICPTEPSQCINCSGIPLTDYPVVCPGVSSPNVCCKTQSACPAPNPTPNPQSGAGGKLADVCDFVTDPTQETECRNCYSRSSADPNQSWSWTAIGCISTNPTGSDGFITTILRFGTGIAGGIAFLLILLGGFQILTSAGNPERLHAGRELVGSAVAGLLLIIFSLFLLRLIGFTILKLPGFG